MATIVSANEPARPAVPNGQASQIIACPPTSTTGSGTSIPAPRRSAPASSQVAIAADTASTGTKNCRTNSSDDRMIAPIETPTTIAATRLRPSRADFSCRGAAACPGVNGGPAEANGRSREAEVDTGSDFEELGFLVLHQVVDLVDVLVDRGLQLLLGAGDLVLAGLARP